MNIAPSRPWSLGHGGRRRQSLHEQRGEDALARSECGLWDLRLTLGSRTRFGVDLSYTGVAGTVRAPTSAQTATLIGTASEATSRVTRSLART